MLRSRKNTTIQSTDTHILFSFFSLFCIFLYNLTPKWNRFQSSIDRFISMSEWVDRVKSKWTDKNNKNRRISNEKMQTQTIWLVKITFFLNFFGHKMELNNEWKWNNVSTDNAMTWRVFKNNWQMDKNKMATSFLTRPANIFYFVFLFIFVHKSTSMHKWI